MRISFSRDIASRSKTTLGWLNFLHRLSVSLSNDHGVHLVKKSQKSDIHLVLLGDSIKRGSKNVARIDGIYYDRPRLRMNNSIRRSIQVADGVVFQSKWSQRFVTNFLRVKPKRSVVIWNGVDQKKLRSISEDPGRKDADHVFVCCAHWNKRPAKRIKAIVKAFLKAHASILGQSKMIVIGRTDVGIRHPLITFIGKVNHKRVISSYKRADYLCHICHIDACPNSVVEALSVGLPILCNNIGGTPEIVADSGIQIPIDTEPSYEPIRSMKDVGSSKIDHRLVADGMIDMTRREWSVHRPDLDISASSAKYVEFFRKILA